MDYMCILKKGIWVILGIIVFFLAGKIFIFYTPFLIAYIISLIIEPLIKLVCKKTDWSRKASSIIVLVTIFTILISIITWGVISLVSETTNLLSGLNTYLEKAINFVQGLFSRIDLNKFEFSKEVSKIGESTATNFLNTITNFIKNTLNKILNYITSIPTILIYVVITILATYFITSDKFYILDRMEHHLSKKMVGKLITHTKKITTSLGGYLKAELILIAISFIIVLIGLNIFYLIGMNVEYPILMAILIGFVDALPILGAGTIMVPWSIMLFLNKDISLSLSILGLFILISVVKQLLEPKIVSNKIGIHPIFTLISMYTGFKIIGILGLLIGPIILIILKNIFSEVLDKGIMNAITDE